MAAAGLDTAAALRERQRLAAREDVEEELFVSRCFQLLLACCWVCSLNRRWREQHARTWRRSCS